MPKSIKILDQDYTKWIAELSSRYRRSQIKAAVKVNSEMLQYYWELGRDIVEKKAESRWGSGFMKNLSVDLRELNPDATCFSETNLLYMKNFYLLYKSCTEITPQLGEQFNKIDNVSDNMQVVITPQLGEQSQRLNFAQQVIERIRHDIFVVPWGHHKTLIDKFKLNWRNSIPKKLKVRYLQLKR